MAELEPINKHFQLLAALPPTSRSALLQHITKVMEDQGAVASLESLVCGNRASPSSSFDVKNMATASAACVICVLPVLSWNRCARTGNPPCPRPRPQTLRERTFRPLWVFWRICHRQRRPRQRSKLSTFSLEPWMVSKLCSLHLFSHIHQCFLKNGSLAHQ